MSERPSNYEWHIAQKARISRLAANVALHFTVGHEAVQTPEYNAEMNEMLWQQHVRAEHDKFEPPEYSDHRFC